MAGQAAMGKKQPATSLRTSLIIKRYLRFKAKIVERAGIEPAQTQDFTLVLYLTELPLRFSVAGAMGFDPAFFCRPGYL